MKKEIYDHLQELLWARIMVVGNQKNGFPEIEASFSEISDDAGYNIVQMIIECLANEKSPEITMLTVNANLLQLDVFVPKSDLFNIVTQVEDKNEFEIIAVQTMWGMIEDGDSWENICRAVEIIITPSEY